jgi:4-amino-4-deoxy-L-arabinose transferase-like glycosyltransferase
MKNRVIILVLLALLLRLPFIGTGPFYKDEALYAEIIEEMKAGGELLPHYAGEVVTWKPPLMFWVYSALFPLFEPLGLPAEVLYRLPGVLLGALCTVLVYYLVREISGDEDLGFVAGIAYAGTALSIIVNRTFIPDTLLSVFLLGSVLLYFRAKEDRKLALAAGLMAGLAILTKTLMGLFAPVLAVAYYAFYERRMLTSREFLASLLFIPVSFAIVYALLPGVGDQSLIDTTQRTAGLYQLGSVGKNLIVLLTSTMPWLVIAMYGVYKYGREVRAVKFWYVWLVLGLVPVVASGELYWYFLPLLPAISVFSGKVVLAGGKADRFAVAFALFLVLFAPIGAYAYANMVTDRPEVRDSGAVGGYLDGRDALLVMGYNPTLLYYKIHSRKDYGSVDAFFVQNHTLVQDGEFYALIMNSTLPADSVGMYRAVSYPYLANRIYFGNFTKPRGTIAFDRDIYERRIAGREEYSGLKRIRETEFFVVVER